MLIKRPPFLYGSTISNISFITVTYMKTTLQFLYDRNRFIDRNSENSRMLSKLGNSLWCVSKFMKTLNKKMYKYCLILIFRVVKNMHIVRQGKYPKHEDYEKNIIGQLFKFNTFGFFYHLKQDNLKNLRCSLMLRIKRLMWGHGPESMVKVYRLLESNHIPKIIYWVNRWNLFFLR